MASEWLAPRRNGHKIDPTLGSRAMPDDQIADDQIATIEAPSGFRQLLGYRLTHWAEHQATIELAIDERHMNRGGFVHGGVITTLIDTAGGYAGCYCATPGRVRRCVTISLSTQFLGAVKHGSLVAQARVRGGGKRIFGATIDVRDRGGAVIATGEAMYRYRTGHEHRDGVKHNEATPGATDDAG